MGGPRRHHYVPQFLLREWEQPQKGSLLCFKKGANGVEEFSSGAADICVQRDLYALLDAEGRKHQHVETAVMSDQIDGPASSVHKKLLSEGADCLSKEEKISWTYFLISLKTRTPDVVKGTSQRIDQKVKDDLVPELENQYQEIRSDDMPPTISDEALRAYSPLVHNAGLRPFEAQIRDKKLFNIIYQANWGVRTLKEKANFEFLINDRPAIIDGHFLDKTDSIYHLPLSPFPLFYAARESFPLEKTLEMDDSEFVPIVNKARIAQTDKFIFGQTYRNYPLIKRYFKKGSV